MGIAVLTGPAVADKERRTWDYSAMVEVTIDRPAREVWSYFFGERKGTWTKGRYTTIAGEPGKVGEVFTPADPVYGIQCFFEAVKVQPERQLVLKMTYREDERDERKLMGYDLVTLSEVAGRTTVVLQQVFALPVDVPKDDLALETAKQDRMLAGIFRDLQAVVENSQ